MVKEDIEIEISVARVVKREGIIHIYYKDEVEVTVDHIDELSEALFKLVGEKRYPVINFPGKYTLMSREARERDNSNVLKKNIICSAVVLQSTAQRMLFHFYKLAHSFSYPLKAFDSKEKAEVWIREVMSESDSGPVNYLDYRE